MMSTFKQRWQTTHQYPDEASSGPNGIEFECDLTPHNNLLVWLHIIKRRNVTGAHTKTLELYRSACPAWDARLACSVSIPGKGFTGT